MKCSACGQASASLQSCTGCSESSYCSSACQLAHWKSGGHKEACAREDLRFTGAPLSKLLDALVPADADETVEAGLKRLYATNPKKGGLTNKLGSKPSELNKLDVVLLVDSSTNLRRAREVWRHSFPATFAVWLDVAQTGDLISCSDVEKRLPVLKAGIQKAKFVLAELGLEGTSWLAASSEAHPRLTLWAHAGLHLCSSPKTFHFGVTEEEEMALMERMASGALGNNELTNALRAADIALAAPLAEDLALKSSEAFKDMTQRACSVLMAIGPMKGLLIRTGEKALTLADNEDGKAAIHACLGRASVLLDDPRRGHAHFRECLRLLASQKKRDRMIEFEASECARALGEHKLVETYLREVLEEVREDDAEGQSRAAFNYGMYVADHADDFESSSHKQAVKQLERFLKAKVAAMEDPASKPEEKAVDLVGSASAAVAALASGLKSFDVAREALARWRVLAMRAASEDETDERVLLCEAWMGNLDTAMEAYEDALGHLTLVREGWASKARADDKEARKCLVTANFRRALCLMEMKRIEEANKDAYAALALALKIYGAEHQETKTVKALCERLAAAAAAST